MKNIITKKKIVLDVTIKNVEKERERVNWPKLIEGFRYSPDLCGQLQRVRAPVFYTQVSFHGQFTCLNTNQYRLCAVPRLGITFFFFSIAESTGGPSTFPFLYFSHAMTIQPFFFSRIRSSSIVILRRLSRQLLGTRFFFSFPYFPYFLAQSFWMSWNLLTLIKEANFFAAASLLMLSSWSSYSSRKWLFTMTLYKVISQRGSRQILFK